MAKDKLITIRIESDKLEAFKRWTDKRDINLSSFLYDVIEACLDGRIDERIITNERLDGIRIDEIIDNRLASVPTREEMTAAIESLRSEFSPALELAGK